MRYASWTRAATVAAIVCVTCAVAVAQDTTVDIKNGVVVGVEGNVLVVRTAEGVQEFNVPEGFRFDMEGRQMSVHELKPGMRLTALIKTTTTPLEVYTTEVKEGEVVLKSGSTIAVRTPDGKVHRFTPKSAEERGVRILRDGKPVDFFELHEGDMVTATIVSHAPPQIMTEKEFQVLVESPPAAPRPAPVAAARPPAPPPPPPPATARPATATPAALPKTASELPLLGLGGIVLLGLGLGLTLLRKVVAH